MKAHHLSGSKIHLAMEHCSYWARPEIVHPARPLGAPARRGNTVHKASDCNHKGDPLPEFHDDTGALWAQLKTWLASEAPYTHSELPLLYDAEHDAATICETGELGERDYLGVTALKVPMRLDLLRVGEGVAWIADIKTGSISKDMAAPVNIQLASAAVAVSRLFGVERVHVGLVVPMKTKCHAPSWYEMDTDKLDLHAGRLHRTLQMLPTSQPNVGDHCFRCPIGPAKGHMAECPGWAQDEAAQ